MSFRFCGRILPGRIGVWRFDIGAADGKKKVAPPPGDVAINSGGSAPVQSSVTTRPRALAQKVFRPGLRVHTYGFNPDEAEALVRGAGGADSISQDWRGRSWAVAAGFWGRITPLRETQTRGQKKHTKKGLLRGFGAGASAYIFFARRLRPEGARLDRRGGRAVRAKCEVFHRRGPGIPPTLMRTIWGRTNIPDVLDVADDLCLRNR